jgi:hypothetical protein
MAGRTPPVGHIQTEGPTREPELQLNIGWESSRVGLLLQVVLLVEGTDEP